MKNISDKDIAINMKLVWKKLAVCDHFCNNKPRNAKFYHWFSLLTKDFIREMCETCALREAWGYNYKQSRRYKKWSGS